jgi:hypothetical protein
MLSSGTYSSRRSPRLHEQGTTLLTWYNREMRHRYSREKMYRTRECDISFDDEEQQDRFPVYDIVS